MCQFNMDFQFLIRKLEAVYSAITTEVVAYQLAYLYTFVWHNKTNNKILVDNLKLCIFTLA